MPLFKTINNWSYCNTLHCIPRSDDIWNVIDRLQTFHWRLEPKALSDKECCNTIQFMLSWSSQLACRMREVFPHQKFSLCSFSFILLELLNWLMNLLRIRMMYRGAHQLQWLRKKKKPHIWIPHIQTHKHYSEKYCEQPYYWNNSVSLELAFQKSLKYWPMFALARLVVT